MKTGIELIAIEREEQLTKHGRTIQKDVIENTEQELGYFAGVLCQMRAMDVKDTMNYLPPKWDKELCRKMLNKPYKERLIIAGALIAAEIDRINQ